MTNSKPFEYLQTPKPLIEACVSYLIRHHLYRPVQTVIDVGAGEGQWGQTLSEKLGATVIGVDSYFKGIEHDDHQHYSEWHNQDYLTYRPEPVDLIVGNPPFSLGTEFVMHSIRLLKDNGVAAFILPHNFIYSNKRVDNFWFHGDAGPFMARYMVEMAAINPRPSFTGDGVTGVRQDFSLYIFKRWPQLESPRVWWLKWDKNGSK